MTSEQLKNSILQFAVQGKLVPQNPHDEPASELLKKIKAEKEKLIKEKVIKREIPSLPIKDEEKPFELPDSWEWCRLGLITNFIDYRGKTPNKTNSGIKLITAKNVKYGYFSTIPEEYISEDDYSKHMTRGIPKYGDILFTTEAPLGNACFLESLEIFAIAQRIITIQPIILNNHYLLNVILSKAFQKQIIDKQSGMTAKGIQSKKLVEVLIPLPPLAEQQRIVNKIEELLPLVEQYGTVELELRKLNTKFPEQLKKSVLQYAVQGKLVPQNPHDEPALLLLEKIKAEKKQLIKEKKIKQDKPLPEIKEDEIPFEIPDSWVWVRLGTICNFGNNGSVLSSNISDNSWILELEDIEKETGRIINYSSKKDRVSVSNKNIFKAGNVLYSKLRPYLNKVVVVENDGYCSSEIFPLDFGSFIYNKYAQLFLMSPFFVDYATTKSYGTKMPRFGTSDGQNVPFPLPPLSEQKLIVEKVEEVLSYCNKLK